MQAAQRKQDTGLEKPIRPCPRDFRETYIRLGWETITEHYRTNWRCIRRWINETGREELREARRAHVTASGLHFLHLTPQR